MALAAEQVVAAVAALLVPMAATAGRVYTDRTWPLTEAELPAWILYAGNEPIDTQNLSGSLLTHHLEITATCTTRAVSGLDRALNALDAAGRTLLFAGTPPYNLTITHAARGMAQVDEAAAGRVTLSLLATYQTLASQPETILT